VRRATARAHGCGGAHDDVGLVVPADDQAFADCAADRGLSGSLPAAHELSQGALAQNACIS
jgi:hypothetical protein